MSENYLIHFGNKNSGRYRRGSGERPHQHDGLQKRKDKYINKIKRTQSRTDWQIKRLSEENKNAAKARSLKKKVEAVTDPDDEIRDDPTYTVEEKRKFVDWATSENKKYVDAMIKAKPMYNKAIKDIQNAKGRREVKKIFYNLKYNRPDGATIGDDISSFGFYTDRGRKKYGNN